jgi:hypothetical protein
MLLPYFRDSDTTSLNLINRFALKLNISDTATMLTPYMKKADTISLSNRIDLKLNISDTTILSNRITTNANNIITINNKLATKLDTIYTKFKDVVTMIENKDTINIGSSLTDGYAINIIGDSVNVDSIILDARYPDRDTTNELQDITFATTAGIVTISGSKIMNLDTLYNSVIDSVNLLIRDSIAAFTPLTEGYGINIIGDSINVDTSIIFTQSDTITLSNRIDLKLNISDTLDMLAPYLREADTISLSNRINTKLDTIYVNYQTNVDVITNKDTINITPLTEGFGINIIADSINIDSAVILATQQKQIAYVKNQSEVTMYKGQAVYSSGSSGNNKLVQLASSNTEQASSKTFGIVETDSIPNGGHGYIITFGVLSGFNTNALTEGSSVYLSNTPGELTTTKPQAPLHLVTIGVCIRKQQNNGSIFVKIQNGFEFDELHDVRLTDLVDKASIYYNSSEDLWRDTTAALLVSDTASMLSKYVNTYSNQTGINGDKTFNNIVTIDSATVTGKLLVNTNISDAVKISSNTNSTNLELANNSGNSVFIKSSNRNMTLQTDTTALMYLNGETNRVGILTMNPEQALEVAGTIRVDSLGSNTLTPTKLVGANDANDLSDVKLGTGLSFSNDTLKIADNIINSGDTATLLRQDFIPLTSNQVIWTQGNKKLLSYFTQVYRNGQLLKSDSQYTITNDSIVTLEEGSYRLGDNITIIAIDNIVALAGSGGIITLQGDVTGSGTSSITTYIGANKVTNTMLAGSISNDKLNTITTVGKVSNSATTATDVNTNNAIVLRDASGNFSAGTITASLNGNASTATNVAYSGLTGTVPTWNQNTTGNAATVTTNANLTGDVTSTGNNTSIATGVIVNADINASAAIAVSKLAASTISGITLGNNLNTLTISSPLTGTSYDGSSAVSIGLQAATTSVAGSMSAADKSKLDGIAAGAQVNVPTNLAQGTRTTTTVPITSSTGTPATLNVATTSLAGVMSSADKTKLDGIASGATANTGTVTSVATGYGITGGTITTTGTLLLDSAVVFSQIRDSIVDVAIGTDTIKILKQEYAPATTSVLTWTVTPKFPIQLKQYILVFRNGQLLINDQYNLTDTNQITIVSNSFKIGSNYTVVTVSGIGSVGTGVFPNLVYPEAGIALSTGSAWASSIPNNSANWNIAFNDKINNAAFTGTTTKTLTLTQYDGGTFTPTFNDLQGVTEVTAGTGLTGGTITSTGTVAVNFGVVAPLANPTFTGTVSGITKSMVGLGNVDNTSDANKPISTATQTALNTKQNTLVSSDNIKTINSNSLLGSGNISVGTVTSVGGIGTVSGLTLTGSVTTSGNLTLGGTLSLTSGNVTTALGYTPYNSTNPNNYINRTGLSFVAGSGAYNSTTGVITIPTNNNQITNGAGYATQTALDTKQNTLSGTGFVKASGTTISYDNSTYLTTGTAASTYQTILTNPVTGTGTNDFIAKFTSTGSTIGNSVIQESSGNIGIGITPTSNLELARGKFITLNSRESGFPEDSSGIMMYETGTKTATDIDFGAKIMYNSVSDNFEIKMKNYNGVSLFNPPVSISIPRATGIVNIGTSLAVTGAITEGGNNVLTNLDTASLSSRIDGKVSLTGDETINGFKSFNNIVNVLNGMTISGSVSGLNKILGKITPDNRVGEITVGTGLDLTNNVLSATGGGVTSVTASSPLSSTGGATPNITITDAGAAASGVVNTTTQSFAGNKTFTGTLDVSSTGTFGGRVKTNWLERNYAYSTSSSFTVSVNTTWQDINTSVLTTITLPNAATYPGKELHLRQTGAGSVQSASSNIIPFLVAPTGSTSNGILIPAGNVRAATLVSDGDNWIIMQRNN